MTRTAALTATPTPAANRVSFAIHDVEPASYTLGTVKTRESLEQQLKTLWNRDEEKRPLESCSDYVADCVSDLDTHPLIGATHLAYSEHRPLILSPDMIWVAIVQGLAQHLHNQPERFRDRLVDHSGKRTLRVIGEKLVPGSPENLWARLIQGFSDAMRTELGDRYARFVSDFSTTGPAELAACQVALMDLYEPYYEYEAYGICGVPRLTLEGEVDDWRKLRAKIDILDEFELEWWTPSLRVIADQFVRAASGDVDLGHWRNIHKFEQAYGPARINGWMAWLFPYVETGGSQLYTTRNPIFNDPAARVTSWMLPSGISSVPLSYSEPGEQGGPEFVEMFEILGGFVGVEQNAETLELRPKLGWGIRRGGATHRRFRALRRFQPAPPVSQSEFRRLTQERPQSVSGSGELRQFYRWCDGATLFPGPNQATLRPLADLVPVFVDLRLASSEAAADNRFLESHNHQWLRFCDFADGSFAAIATAPYYGRNDQGRGKHWLIIRAGEVEGSGAMAPHVIAWSFYEFLDLLLKEEGIAGNIPAKTIPGSRRKTRSGPSDS